MSYRIAPSLLAADWARLGAEAAAVITAGADILHLDVMDQHYVPNLSIGPQGCYALRRYGITAPIDVHLMVEPVDELITQFAAAGATEISFHPEASRHVDRSLALIRAHHCRAGLAINPASSLECLRYVLDKLDFVLLMTVNPGFGGQTLITELLPKITHAKELLASSTQPINLAVDGGINLDNIARIATAGADTFIVGSALFTTPNYATTITALRHKIMEIS